ncbi:MAG: HlyD family efflux transporter periplasmic adaptor subunit [Candidatus Delongbacteria bacterium]|jgi:multidrug efflux pump subunit AcrA (membrane-fusion protein)|nr:HlyD family efflux transporter periplasmic adaptor subunit [Candidatus Delongbacteria bacterium]
MNSKRPKLRSTDSNEAKIRDQNFNDLSEVFLETPPPFILRGPIYVIVFILLTAIIYSSVTSVNIKISGYMTVKGEEHVVQSPVNGLVNVIYQLDNSHVQINDKLISLFSQSTLYSENNLKVSAKKKDELLKRYLWLQLFKSRIDSLVVLYTKKNIAFKVDIPKFNKEYSPEQGSNLSDTNDSSDFSSIGNFDLKYLSLEQNIVSLWNEYQRTKKLTEQVFKTYQENKNLLDKSFISQQEYQNSEQNYNQSKARLENIIRDFKISILSTYDEIYQGLDGVISNLISIDSEIESVKNMLSGIEITGNSFLIRSKYSGIISDVYVKTSQMVSEGIPLFRMIRDDYPLYGIIYVATGNVSQVEKDQDVSIKFDAFPFQIYGIQRGKVVSVSDDVKFIDGAGYVYEVTVALIKDESITLKPGEGGFAEINTGKKKIIEIMIAPVTKIFAYLRGEN